jgi:plasmid replication initiation protein
MIAKPQPVGLPAFLPLPKGRGFSRFFVEASYRLTLVEQQIILFAICRARDEQRGLTADTPVTITARDFAAQFGTNETKVYGQLKEAMVTMFERHIVIRALSK